MKMDVDREISSPDTSHLQETPENTDPRLERLRTNMLDRISRSDAHFKHQQRDEPDLEVNEKYKIASDILKSNMPLFLSRFGSYLLPEDLTYFADHRNTYEVDFYLKEIEKQHDKILNRKLVNNRRYAAMQELMDGGEYFSEDEMKWRDPWLYFQMIGQYMTDEDIQAKVDKADLRFSSVLLQHMDQLRENAWYEVLKQKEEGQTEEDEESEEEEEDNDDKNKEKKSAPSEKAKTKISETEKNILRSEFLQIMQERFMTGSDKTFDYSKVDKNTYYDNLETLGKDEEEKYFDEDDDNGDSGNPELMVDNTASGKSTVTEHPDTYKREGREGRGVGDKESEVEDYMAFPCEAVCEMNETAEQLTNMSVSKPDSCSTVTCGDSQHMQTMDNGANEFG